jgi:hypothetical protein
MKKLDSLVYTPKKTARINKQKFLIAHTYIHTLP